MKRSFYNYQFKIKVMIDNIKAIIISVNVAFCLVSLVISKHLLVNLLKYN